MDNRQLRYFCAVYENRNLSHAAQNCNVAQSAISTHISNLEAELGLALFTRQARGMYPTIAGTRLYEHAKVILRSIQAASDDVRQMSDLCAGEIEIGLPHTLIDAIGLDLILNINKELPRANVVIHEALSSELFRHISEGNLDCIFCYNAPDSADLYAQLIHQEELFCVGKPRWFDKNSSEISFEELSKLPQIVLRRGPSSRSVSTHGRFLQRLHNNAILEINSVMGTRKALLAGIGVAIFPIITVSDLLERNEIEARKIADLPITRKLSLVRRVDRLPTALMEKLTKMVQDLIQEKVRAGKWPIIDK